MFPIPKINNKNLIIIHDLFVSVFAWQFAWWCRFNFTFPFEFWENSLLTIPLILIVQSVIFSRFRLYRGVWRFASIPDLWNIFRASIFGALAMTLICFMVFRLEGIPRSILILYPFFLMFFLGAPRLSYRVWKDHSFNLKRMAGNQKVLVVGAGRAGEMLVREMNRDGNYIPVGLFDDNEQLVNSEIHGIKVLGKVDDIYDITIKSEVDLIIIAIPSATSSEMQKIISFCEQTNLPIKTLPGLQDMVSMADALSDIREVSIEDLLGRDKVELDWQEVQKDILNKIILVTGGGGSIGKELCLQIVNFNPSKLIIFERTEFNLYKVEQTLSNYAVSVEAILGDLCDKDKVEHVISKYKPDVIFHAAAYKHVPILEREAREAVCNNIVGTKNIADIADKYACNKFVLISTDKAVNPTNILGITKRIAENYIENLNETSKTNYFTVRFGNVLGSDGSVVPLFREQINKGGPVTVTHPEVTRYFMTIREACQLILQAGSIGKGGEIFVLDMGKSVKINYLAEQMIRLSGLVPGKDIHIEYTGLRPGEKMHEELFYDYEMPEKTSHEKILLAKQQELTENFIKKIDAIIETVNIFDNEKIKLQLRELVPENIENENIISFNKKNTQ